MAETAEKVTLSAGDDVAERSMSRVRLGDLAFDALDEAATVRRIITAAQSGEGGWVVTPNVDILRLCRSDADVRQLLRKATLTLADGMPLIWASRLQRTPLPERVCGSNLIVSVSEAAAEAGLSVFFLGGGMEQTAEKAAAELTRRFGALKVAGCYYPRFGFEKDEAQIAQIARAVEQAQPDIVYVALSVPKTEQLIDRIRHVQPRAWWIGVGISFSFICGEVERAPKWMQKAGLEWLHRMIQEPGRLLRRYLLHDIPFALRLLAVAGWRGLWRRKSPGGGG